MTLHAAQPKPLTLQDEDEDLRVMDATQLPLIVAAIDSQDLIFIAVLGVFIAFWVWMLIDCATHEISPGSKVAWMLLILFVGCLGAPTYFLARKLPRTRSVKKSLIIRLAVLVGVLGFVGLIYSVYTGLTQDELREGAASVSWLPKTASNVSYYLSYSRTAYEFDIAEQDFVKLAESEDWRLQRIESEPLFINNYVFAAQRHPAPDRASLSRTPTEDQIAAYQAQMEAYDAATVKRITNGYTYERRQNNGGGIKVGYDSSQQRAYVYTTPR